MPTAHVSPPAIGNACALPLLMSSAHTLDGTLEGFWPVLTLPKLKTLELSLSCGPTAMPWQVKCTVLPPAVSSWKLWQEKLPVV
jgi:hypothetical protein